MAECQTLIQGTRMRATLIDECGAPVSGASSQVVTDGFISVAMTDNIEKPDEFKVKNAGGGFCVNQRSQPLLNWIDVKITLCQVAPELLNLITGAPLIYDDSTPTASAVGVGTDSDSYGMASFALELWTNVGRTRGSAACGASGTRYGYLLLPWLVEGTGGGVTVENGPMNLEIDCITEEGNDWGLGPYDVVEDNLGNPSRLIHAIPSTRHRHLQLTSLAPPDVQCGFQSLVVPS